MSKLVALMSMSLDGYVAGLNDSVAEVFTWYFNSGDVEIHTGGSDSMTFNVSKPSAEHIRSLTSGLGAVLTGRRTFDAAQGWGGNHAWGPAFVLTHHIPDGWPRPNSTVHFVTDGIESAVNQAKAAAAGKSVAVHGADTIQQCLNAGLLDEIHVDIAAVLLGSGVRLFDHLADTPAVLGNPTVVVGVGVTHLCYPVSRTVLLPQPEKDQALEPNVFTLEQIDDLHTRLGRAETLLEYARALNVIGVEKYDSYVTDGHSEFFGTGHKVSSPPAHNEFPIASKSNRQDFLRYLELSELGKLSYVEMSRGLAESGVEKWTVDTSKLTMIYYDRSGNELLVEELK